MLKELRVLIPAAFLVALGGCATHVQSRVSVFHQLPQAFAAQSTFVVLPWKEDQEGSLEFATYAEQLQLLLAAKGLQPASEGEVPRYAVILDFGIDDGRTEVSSYSIPVFGVTGSSGSTTTGTVNRVGNTSYVNATTTNMPTYGITGFNRGEVSTQVFGRYLSVDFLEFGASGAGPKKVYEGRLKSDGTCGNLSVVMPTLLQALFDKFPGQSGSAGTVALPMQGTC